MNKPIVGVIMPVKDCGQWLMPAVRSIVGQTMPDWELILVDDGTTDGSLDEPARLAQSDPRIRIVRSDGVGGAQALNCGVALSTAPWLARMDGDDVALPTRLERQLLFVEKAPELGMVGAWAQVLIQDRLTDVTMQTPTGPSQLRRKMLDQAAMISPTFLFRRKAWEKVGGFRSWMMLTEDYDFTARVAACWDVDNVPEILLQYRIHATQTTASRLRDLAIHSMMAQRVAVALHSGRPDPLLPFDQVSPAMLLALGLTPEVIWARTVAITTYRVQLLLKLGAPEQARLTLHDVEAEMSANERKRWAGELSWLQAQVHWFSGRRISTGTTLLKGLVRSPELLPRSLKKGMEHVAKKLPPSLRRRWTPEEEN